MVMKGRLYLLLLLIWTIGCSKDGDSKHVSGEEELFDEFYLSFFNDRVFQMSRINFPLRGGSTEYVFDERIHPDIENDKFMVSDGKFYWQEKGWVHLNEMDKSNLNYSLEFTNKTNKVDLIIKSKIDDFIIVMEFELIKKQWYLVYYSSNWY
tara:strand:+ start:48877 stop:49332 length:456 start_codon:yes stop_codon:yes gene_type:complete